MNDKVTVNDFKQWLEHPVTQKFHQHIQKVRSEALSDIVSYQNLATEQGIRDFGYRAAAVMQFIHGMETAVDIENIKISVVDDEGDETEVSY